MMNPQNSHEQTQDAIDLRQLYFDKRLNDITTKLQEYKATSQLYPIQSKIILNTAKMAKLSPVHSKHENNIHLVNSFAMIGWPDLSIKGDKISKELVHE